MSDSPDSPNKPLYGRIALVTGAARGLGRGIADVLAEQGATVLVNYLRSADEAAEVANSINARGGQALPIQADVSQEEDVARLFAEISSRFGRLDILVNNAGTSQAKDIFETTLEDWQRILNTNLTSCFLCSKAAMQLMRPRGYGRIVIISSVVAEQGALFGHVHYAASKGGQLAFAKTLARTGAPYGITVNAVAPGIIDTELLQQTHGTERKAALSAQVPLGLGTVRDVGLAVAFLSGEGARYITGTTIDVNGCQYLR